MQDISILLLLLVIQSVSFTVEEGSTDIFSSHYNRRALKDDTSVFEYPYAWAPCCNFEIDRLKPAGNAATNFILPVTTSGNSFSLFEGIKIIYLFFFLFYQYIMCLHCLSLFNNYYKVYLV
jgi:hypothetical protein